MSPGRKVLFTLIMLLFAVLLLEVFSFALLQFEAWRRPYKFRHDAAYYLDPMPADWASKFYARGYHPVLGWDGRRSDRDDRSPGTAEAKDGEPTGSKGSRGKKKRQKDCKKQRHQFLNIVQNVCA